MYIFLDESGQFTKHNDEEYFVVGSFTIGNQRRTEKAIRGWFREKFPRKLRHLPEIKFSDAKITDDLRMKTLKYISSLDVRIYYTYLLRKNIPDTYIKNEKLLSGHLYTNIIGEILEMYLPINDREFRVFCDQRHLKGIKRSEFKSILKARLLTKLPPGTIVEIEMLDSTANGNIQIADWISGALAWCLEKKHLGDELCQILKNNIIGNKELFENYWEQKHENKKPNQKD